MIYLDNAATSWPKPEAVYQAADKALREYGGNHGRSGHRLSQSAGMVICDARIQLAKLFNIIKSESIVMTSGATAALNLALKGTLRAGDHVITSGMEHNSVIRPLEALKEKGVDYTTAVTSPLSGVDLDDLRASVRTNTKMVVLTHVSNVTGTVNPIEEVGAFCRERGILFLVDASQSAGVLPIDVMRMNIDLLAFPGHKGLMGPQGTGGLYIRDGLSLTPLMEGGTGSRSELMTMPEKGPERYESGTMNTPGIAGLAAGVRFILEQGGEVIRSKEAYLANRLLEGIAGCSKIQIYGSGAGENRSGVISFTIDGLDVMSAGLILDSAFDIAVRAGLHCAPAAHKTIGTFASGGTIRASIGYFNTESDIDRCVEALSAISAEGGI